MGFTYYGDLLGISGYYRLSADQAYKRLNEFYNTTFSCLSDYCNSNTNVKIFMFSDSLLISGDDEQEILSELQKLYLKLINKGLLLRGALVKRKLIFDSRLELDNFRKELPENDTLARAVGLEQTQKGSRLLIENSLVEILLERHPYWMTHEGYFQNIRSDISVDCRCRRICPTPDNKTYEFLYFWMRNSDLNNENQLATIKEQLVELSNIFTEDIAVHYKETLRLFKQCIRRKKLTERRLRLDRVERN